MIRKHPTPIEAAIAKLDEHSQIRHRPALRELGAYIEASTHDLPKIRIAEIGQRIRVQVIA